MRVVVDRLDYFASDKADGVRHDEGMSDAQRTAWLESRGWRVVRFWINDILANREGVMSVVLLALRGG